MKFRKKPVIVEAMQFTGNNCIEILHFMKCPDANNPELHTTDHPILNTLEGRMVADPGDWVIRGVEGEYYPCKPDIFEATYEKVESNLLSAELHYYETHKQELLSLYKDEYIILYKDSEEKIRVLGPYSSFWQAYKDGVKKLGTRPFLLREVTDEEPTYYL